MKIKQWMEFLADKKEHYPVSDKFIRNYQQGLENKNGYVFFAWKTGHIICREISEPNQKWHFFESYMLIMIAQGKIQLDDDAGKWYRKLKCPELLLWIAEAVGIDTEIVNEAERKAREIIDSGTSGRLRNKAGNEITQKIITWEIIKDEIENR
ncbi:hypothetical protein NL50_08690 [Clostridium acetobutylicum]|nr:hypothetical protein NL50_08690 [Clostridium acetobutylicum]